MMMVHPILGETQGRQDARMQDGLDGPQVRSLLNAVRGGEVHAGDDGPQLFTLRPPPAGRINVEAHDFRRPDRLGKEALRAIQTIQQRLAQELGQRLTGCLGSLVEFPAQSMEQTTWADYSDKLPRLTSFVLFRSKGFDTPFFFNLPPKVFYAMLDRLLGGGDQSDLVIPKREPTSIEKQIRAMLIKHMGEALTAAWSVLPTPGFHDESKVESDPKMAPGLAPNEVVVEVTFAFRMSGREGEVSLAIPIRALEPHLDGLVEVLSGGSGRLPDASQKRRLDQRLRTISVEGPAVLGSTSITLGELQSMAVGDVLDLDQEQPSFTVGGGAAWPMHVGNRGDRRIVRLGSST